MTVLPELHVLPGPVHELHHVQASLALGYQEAQSGNGAVRYCAVDVHQTELAVVVRCEHAAALRLDGNAAGVAEKPVREDQTEAVRGFLRAFDYRDIRCVYCLHSHGECYALAVKVAPLSEAALPGRDLREVAVFQRSAVVHRHGAYDLAVYLEGDVDDRRASCQLAESLEVHRRCLAGVAYAVDPGNAAVNEAVAEHLRVVVREIDIACNGAGALGAVVHIEYCGVVREYHALPRDSADITCRGDGDFGDALSDCGNGIACDSSCVAAGCACDLAILNGAEHGAHILLADDTAAVVLLGGYLAGVGAAVDDVAHLVGEAVGALPVRSDVVLRVEVKVYRHGAGDTADVQVALYSAGIGAGIHLSLPAVGFVLGNIGGESVLVVGVEGLVLEFLENVGDNCELVAYLLEVVQEDITLRLRGAANGGNRTGYPCEIIREAVHRCGEALVRRREFHLRLVAEGLYCL